MMMSIYVVAGKVCACQAVHAKTQSRDPESYRDNSVVEQYSSLSESSLYTSYYPSYYPPLNELLAYSY